MLTQATRKLRPFGEPVRKLVLFAVLTLGIVKFATLADEHYPIRNWLFWRYLQCWLLAALVCVACLSAGSAWLGILRLRLPRAERLYTSFTLGLLTFGLALFLAGFIGLYGPVLSVVLPVVLLGVGIRPHKLRRMVPVVRRALARPVTFRSPWTLLLGLFGLGGLLLVYAPTLSPDNIAADSYWYHLTLAQHYAAAGGIVRSPEGSFVAAYPQLASILYSWAFQFPRTTYFDRVEIAAHLEMLVFVWTLVGVALVARRLLRRRGAGMAWVAVFLFPGIFLYDSSLSVAADHILALFGPAIVLTLLRVIESPSPRRAVLFGAMLAGALLTKYQAGMLVVPAIVAFAAFSVFRFVRGPDRGRMLAVAGVAAGTMIVAWAPHWLKNALWYHDPFYPLLHHHLPAKPWVEGAEIYYETIFKANLWRPTGTFGERLWETAGALFTFSFEPHDWPRFHRDVPVFGSLFTLTSVCLPFMRANRRLWGAALFCYAGVFIWYWGSHQDRYLQALMPVMAATTAALLVTIWQSGVLARSGVAALVALQVIWGGDVPFIGAHAFEGKSPQERVLALLKTGYEGNHYERLRALPWWWEMKRTLPRDARLLVHGDLGPVGLERQIVTDMTGWVGGFHYGFLPSAAALHDQLRAYGVTHVVWKKDWTRDWDSYAEDLVFQSFVNQHLQEPFTTHNYVVARLPEERPAEVPYGQVLFLGGGQSYEPGLYPLRSLTVPEYGERPKSEYPKPIEPVVDNAQALLSRADFVVVHRQYQGAPALTGFVKIMHRAGHDLYVRPGPALTPVR